MQGRGIQLFITIVVVQCRLRISFAFLLPFNPPLLPLALRLQELMFNLLSYCAQRAQGEGFEDLEDR
jgi:hypothetical protein